MKLKRGRDCLELFLLPFLLLLTSLIALQCRDSAGFCFPLQAVLWPVQRQAGVEWSNLRPAGTWWNLQPVGTWWIGFGPGETSWDVVEPAGGALWPMAIILLRGEHCHFWDHWVIIEVNIFETIGKKGIGTWRVWPKMGLKRSLPLAKFSTSLATYLSAILWGNGLLDFTRILEFSWSPPLNLYWLLVG